MSAIGTKQTCRVALHMSAFGGKADMPSCTAHVCFLTQSGHVADHLTAILCDGADVTRYDARTELRGRQ